MPDRAHVYMRTLDVKDRNMTTHRIAPRPETAHTDPKLAELLTRFETARQKQLDAIPSTNLDVVTAAYRGSVERIQQAARGVNSPAALKQGSG